jgi:hypothetical protein
MSALRIIVGGWLGLNALLFAALMLRRNRPALREWLFKWVLNDVGRRATAPSDAGERAFESNRQ